MPLLCARWNWNIEYLVLDQNDVNDPNERDENRQRKHTALVR
jgi:hypothetical protein